MQSPSGGEQNMFCSNVMWVWETMLMLYRNRWWKSKWVDVWLFWTHTRHLHLLTHIMLLRWASETRQTLLKRGVFLTDSQEDREREDIFTYIYGKVVHWHVCSKPGVAESVCVCWVCLLDSFWLVAATFKDCLKHNDLVSVVRCGLGQSLSVAC